jgi:hypothetical protein
MMIHRSGTPKAVENHATVKKAEYARFFWLILRGIALIVAIWAFIAFLSSLLYGREWWPTMLGFLLANYALIWIAPKRESLPAIKGDGTEKAKLYRLPDWSLLAYWFTTGLGCNWACAFLWFSRRYALFSGPVVGATGFIMLFYAAIALLVARLTGGNWRTALLLFVAVPVSLAGLVLSFRLLR